MFQFDAIEELKASHKIKPLQEGEIAVTKICVCESAAGFKQSLKFI